jgi:hypothetical protein
MANLAKSNAAWYELYERMVGFALAVARSVDREARRFGGENRTVLQKSSGAHANFFNSASTDFQLSGVKIGTWTLENGDVIVRVTGAGPTYTVTVYRATGAGAGDRLCAGTAAAGAVATLAELNSSGVTGLYKVAASVTADSTDDNRFKVQQDWPLLARTRFIGDDPEGEDTKTLQAMLARLDRIFALMLEARGEARSMLDDLFVASEDNPRAYGSKLLRASFSSLLAETTSVDGSGRVTRVRTGALATWLQCMIDEATGSTQTFRRRAVSAGAGVAVTGNDGQFTIAAHTPEGHCRTGRYTLELVNGMEQDYPTADTAEQWRLKFASDEDDEEKTHAEFVTTKQSYKGEDGFGGTTFVVLRSLTKTGDGSNLHLAAVAGLAVTGEHMGNTARGVLYWKIVGTGPFAVEFYKGSTYLAADLVAQSPAVAAATAFTAAATQQSGLSVVGTTGSAPVNGTTGTLDCNFGSTLNSSNKPDELYVDVSLTDQGETAKIMARLGLLTPNGVASSELVDDDLVKANGHVDDFGAEV